ncbi:MAG: hypothetical protein JSS10_08200 [Verrucomicrobia bacterium]|nr:hypothetical protein [Verrucomicrobiota bacterium]
MHSLCVQSVQDLFVIPFYTLPSGDKNDRLHGEENCKLWIATATSTALAAGFFFANIGALKAAHFALQLLADKFDAYESANFFSLFANNAVLWVLSRIYVRRDYQAFTLAALATNAYSGIRSYKAGNYIFCGISALFSYRILSDNDQKYRYFGSWKGSIERFAENWAPTMAAYYGYRPAPQH